MKRKLFLVQLFLADFFALFAKCDFFGKISNIYNKSYYERFFLKIPTIVIEGIGTTQKILALYLENYSHQGYFKIRVKFIK